MKGPDRRLREALANAEIEDESTVEDMLSYIYDQLVEAGTELPSRGGRASTQLSALEAWTSLASYVVGRFYGPSSPMRRDIAGWGEKAAKELRRIADVLEPVLRWIAERLKAASFSIAVGFPWGISVGLAFPVAATP